MSKSTENLFERFRESGSSTMAKHRLVKLKQENLAMHTYTAEFTKITEQAYSMHPNDPGTQTLTTTFIEGVNNVHVKNKLRGYPIGTLKAMFDNAINEDHKQRIRATDFKDQNKSSSIFNTELNAVGSDKCFRCNKEGHFAKDCLLNRDESKTQYNKYSAGPKTKGSENPIDQLSRAVTDLAAQVKRLETPSIVQVFTKSLTNTNLPTETIEIGETIDTLTKDTIKTARTIDIEPTTNPMLRYMKWKLKVIVTLSTLISQNLKMTTVIKILPQCKIQKTELPLSIH